MEMIPRVDLGVPQNSQPHPPNLPYPSMKLTYIEWDDSTSPHSGPWISEDDPQLQIDKPYVIVSIGFVVRENEHYVQLASSADFESCNEGDFKGSQVGGVMNIPQRQVSKRCEFEIGKKVAKVPRLEWVRA